MQCVSVQRTGRHAVLALNLPEKRNPISTEMRTALLAALKELEHDPGVRAVVITGTGPAFCSGLDLAAFAEQQQQPIESQRADAQAIADFFATIYGYAKPTLAALNGPAVAGGAGLALLCDITFMSHEAWLSFGEVKIGFVPALVGVYLIRLAGPKLSRDLLISGRKMTADEAFQCGLAQRVLPSHELLSAAEAYAEEIARNGPEAVKQTKKLILQAEHLSLDAALTEAIELNAAARLTSECREGVSAFLTKRSPGWLA
ncbi:MAG TPA: enoyl-CoA hydratase/isomerase family protein [Planctomycetota bacterium]|nr:enoyl-CoA hydratase/isomerase family protein [Planctomycetota bacterium]